jgi:hypothetical protein
MSEAGGPAQLWVRSLDALDAKPLSVANPQGVRAIFWSPDSRALGFSADGKLKKVSVSGGQAQTLCAFQGTFMGGAWSREGVIIFGTTFGQLMRVQDTGGTPTPVTPDLSRDEVFHAFPVFLPDQRHFLYLRQKGGPRSGLYLGSLDSPRDQESNNPVLFGNTGPVYVPSPESDVGSLLVVRNGALVAQPFDQRDLVVKGDAVPLADDLGVGFSFSASLTGVLVYRPGVDDRGGLTWFDRAGKLLETIGDPGRYLTVAISPDGTRVVASRIDGDNQDRAAIGNLWIYEFSRGTRTRLTSASGSNWGVWSPHGDKIIFSSTRDGSLNVYERPSSGGQDEAVFKSKDPKFAQDWSHDGSVLLYSTRKAVQAANVMELWFLHPEGAPDPQPYLTTAAYASQGRFSPNDRFVAYTSNQSGRPEIYVRPFPESARAEWTVSKGGGTMPRWRGDGKELFYVSGDSTMMAVDVSTSTPEFQVGLPKPLFRAPISGGSLSTTTNVTRYDVTADGTKFLINAVRPERTAAEATPITVVLNWQEELKQRVPTR